MFKRLNESLFNPKEIGKYLSDRVGYVILYLLFLSFIVSIPTIILVSTQSELTASFKSSIVSSIQYSDIEGEIVDYKYEGEKFAPIALDSQYFFGVKSDDTQKLGFVFILEEEAVDFYVGGQKIDSHSLEKLQLENLNFELTNKEDRDNLGEAFNIIYKEYKNYNIAMTSISQILSQLLLGLFLIILVVAINSFVLPKMIFKYRFILTSYASTVYFLTVLLDALFGFTFISFIGIILMSMNLRKAYTRIVQISLMQKRKESDENE